MENVKTVERSTTIVEGAVKIHTVEHVLSALSGMGVDNALIEMDANEPPIGDGSAKEFVAAIKKAGLVDQDAPRVYIEPREPIVIEVGGSMVMVSSRYEVPCLVHAGGTGGALHPVPQRGNHAGVLREGNFRSAHVCFL